MRIFVLGVGTIGSMLAQLLARQGHAVSCGDKDPDRAQRFLGARSTLPLQRVNARNLSAIVKAARGSHLVVNTAPAVCNEIVLRAALRIRAHYLDTASHLTRTPFKAEQLRYNERFRHKNRTALINAGVAPGLTNLLVARAADKLDTVDSAHIRLYESAESADPLSQWSAEVSFDEAVARPRIYRDGRFHLGKRFGEREVFRFPTPIGKAAVVLAAQDEVGTIPHYIRMRDMDVKIGGNEMDRLRRWYRQGKLWRSRGMVTKRFPLTLTPRQVAHLIRRGRLHNARFAAAILVRGVKDAKPRVIRLDAALPTLYQIRLWGMHATPIAWATAQMTSLFIKHFPRSVPGVLPPEALPATLRQAILADARARGLGVSMTMKLERPRETDEVL
jgi:hypothetical protein